MTTIFVILYLHKRTKCVEMFPILLKQYKIDIQPFINLAHIKKEVYLWHGLISEHLGHLPFGGRIFVLWKGRWCREIDLM
jgi:hypothetical protein